MKRFLIKHKTIDNFYVAQRAGSWCRWAGRDEAKPFTETELEELAPDARQIVELIEVKEEVLQ